MVKIVTTVHNLTGHWRICAVLTGATSAVVFYHQTTEVATTDRVFKREKNYIWLYCKKGNLTAENAKIAKKTLIFLNIFGIFVSNINLNFAVLCALCG